MQEFPKWVFRKKPGGKPGETESRLVHTASEAAQLEGAWFENPDCLVEPPDSGVHTPPPAAPLPPDYVPQEYPKILYCREATEHGKPVVCSRTVQNADDERALGDAWHDSPADCEEPALAAVAEEGSPPKSKRRSAT